MNVAPRPPRRDPLVTWLVVLAVLLVLLLGVAGWAAAITV